MCMLDDADGMVAVLGDEDLKARKEHKCHECYRQIGRGEVYKREATVFEGRFEAHKTCSHCLVVREWLSKECRGWIYGMVQEDIKDHAEAGYGEDIRQLADGMYGKWMDDQGQLMPIPKMPLTTKEKEMVGA